MAKIAPYKFINPGAITSAAPEVKVAKKQLLATNRIGSTVEGIGNLVKDLRDNNLALLSIQKKQLERQKLDAQLLRDAEAEAKQERARSRLDSQREKLGKENEIEVDKSAGDGFTSWIEKTFGPIVNIFKDIATIIIAKGVTEWLSDEENREKIKSFLEKAGYVFGVIKKFVEDRVNNILDGFSALTDGNNDFWTRLKGLGTLLLGIIGLKYLLNPFSLIDDIIGLIGLIFGKTPDVPDKPSKPKKPDKPKKPSKPTKPPVKPANKPGFLQNLKQGFENVIEGGKAKLTSINNWWAKNSKAFIDGAKGVGKGVYNWGANTAKQIGDLAKLVKDPAKLKDVVLKKLKDTLKPVLEKDETIKKVFNIAKNPKALGKGLINTVKNVINSPATKQGLKFLKEARKNVKIGGLDAVLAALFALLDYGVFGESPINAIVTALGSLLGYSAGFAIGAPFGGLPGFITGAAGGVAGEFIAGKLLEALATGFPQLTTIEDPVAKQLFPDSPPRFLLRNPAQALPNAEALKTKVQASKGGKVPLMSKGGLLKGIEISPQPMTPMQQWAQNFPVLASRVKPGQSGYEEIQSVIKPNSSTNIGGPSQAIVGKSPSSKQVAPPIIKSRPKFDIGNYGFSQKYAIINNNTDYLPVAIPVTFAKPVPVPTPINTSQQVIVSKRSPLLDY